MRFIALSTLATVLAFLPKPASACTIAQPPGGGGGGGDGCKPTVVVTSLTASAPAIPISEHGAVETVRLLTASGTEVIGRYTKDSWKDRATPILAFASPPAPGDYQLEYQEGCPAGVLTKPPTLVHAPVTITAAVPAPVSVGTFTTENRSLEDGQIWTYSGACYVTMKYVKLDVVFHASPELEPFRQVSGYEIKIDGQTYNSLAPPEAGTSKDIPLLALHAACDGDDRQTGGLTLGPHTVSVTWHPAGATANFPEATTTIDLTCDNTSTPSAGTSPDGGANAASPSDSGGCSTTGHTPLSTLVGALFVLVALRRRTRVQA